MVLQKNDFVEIEFTGKVKDGEVFDSNVKSELEKLNKGSEIQPKPFVFSLGQGMFLKGIEDFLIGKDDSPKNYEIELSPIDAFGERSNEMIKLMPIKIFNDQRINPVPGFSFNFDGRIGKVLSVSGGRVIVDFNHPLAGKTVVYNINLLKKVEDTSLKVKSFLDFLFKKDIEFKIDQDKLIIKVEKEIEMFVKLFEEKFKEIFNLNLSLEVIEKSIKNEVSS